MTVARERETERIDGREGRQRRGREEHDEWREMERKGDGERERDRDGEEKEYVPCASPNTA